ELARSRDGGRVRSRRARDARSPATGDRPRARSLPTGPARARGSLVRFLDLHATAEALDRDARIAVADRERERPAVAPPAAPPAPRAILGVVAGEPRREIRLDAAAVALHVEARRGVRGQAQPDRAAEAAYRDAPALRERGGELDLARHRAQLAALELR